MKLSTDWYSPVAALLSVFQGNDIILIFAKHLDYDNNYIQI